MMRPGSQVPPAQGPGASPVETRPVRAEQKVVKKEGGEGPTVAPTEAAPGRHYPNPWISEGGKRYSPSLCFLMLIWSSLALYGRG